MGWREWYNDQALEQQEEFDEVARVIDQGQAARIEMIWANGQYRDRDGGVRQLDPLLEGPLLDYWLTGGRRQPVVLEPGVYALTLQPSDAALDWAEDRQRELTDLLLARWLKAYKGALRLTGWNPAPDVDYELQVLRPVIQAAGISAELVAPAAGGAVVLDETQVVGDGVLATEARVSSWNAAALLFGVAAVGILIFRK